MMKHSNRRLVTVALVLAATGTAAAAPEKPAGTPEAQRPPALGPLKYRSIFPQHAPAGVQAPLLAEEGAWDADVELYVGEPARQPIRKKGVQVNRLVSGGNAIVNEFRYLDGSYSGAGMWGWDAFTNRYTGTWIDSETHLVRHDVGYYDPRTHTLRWEADTMQPDGATTRMRILQTFLGDTRTFRIDLMDAKTGEYKKLIFMTFKRRAAPAAGHRPR